MKRGKKLFALLLAGLMAASMAACGGTGGSSSSSAGTSSGEDSSTSSESSVADTSSTAADDGEVVTLVVWGQGTANSADVDEVAAAISEITRESIGVEVSFVRGQDGEQVNLALTSGEQIDLLNYNPVSGGLGSLVSKPVRHPPGRPGGGVRPGRPGAD